MSLIELYVLGSVILALLAAARNGKDTVLEPENEKSWIYVAGAITDVAWAVIGIILLV